jgi:hypothetical protein
VAIVPDQSFNANGVSLKEGKEIQLWATSEEGNLAMTAEVLLASVTVNDLISSFC